jgi:hypothetical protein
MSNPNTHLQVLLSSSNSRHWGVNARHWYFSRKELVVYNEIISVLGGDVFIDQRDVKLVGDYNECGKRFVN